MKTEVALRMVGMQALIGALGLVEAERFLASVSRDQFNDTEWRKSGLPDLSMDDIAAAANPLSAQLNRELPLKT